MNNYMLIFLLSIIALYALIIHFTLRTFRSKLKQGDTVGVRFGDYVVPRRVVKVLDGEVAVSSYGNTQLEFVDISRVYFNTEVKEIQ